MIKVLLDINISKAWVRVHRSWLPWVSVGRYEEQNRQINGLDFYTLAYRVNSLLTIYRSRPGGTARCLFDSRPQDPDGQCLFCWWKSEVGHRGLSFLLRHIRGLNRGKHFGALQKERNLTFNFLQSVQSHWKAATGRVCWCSLKIQFKSSAIIFFYCRSEYN